VKGARPDKIPAKSSFPRFAGFLRNPVFQPVTLSFCASGGQGSALDPAGEMISPAPLPKA
jgi:hypothetical protein